MNDTLERKAIINNIHENIFVDASAGAGKTTSLVARMVRMVEEGIDVSEICTITFTKNAANEFYERFQHLLAVRSSDGKKVRIEELMPERTSTSKERCRKALENIDLCFMGTIDSFTNMVLSEHPQEAKISSSCAVASSNDIQDTIARIFLDMKSGFYDKIEPSLAFKCSSFCECFMDPLKEYQRECLFYIDRRCQEIASIPSLSKDRLKEKVVPLAKMIIKALYENRCELLSSSNIEEIENIYNHLYAFDIFNRIYLVDSYLTKIENFKISKSKFEESHAFEELLPYFEEISTKSYGLSSSTKNIFNEVKLYRMNMAISFIKESRNIVSDTLKEARILSYTECLIILKEMLKEDILKGGTLCHHISSLHKYYLLDESQDTNPIQTEIFFYLASLVPTLDLTKCDLREGSLFIVGDPKQSIYRFRGADVSAYLKTEEIFKNKFRVIELTQNYRSSKLLREQFNHTFNNYLQVEEGNPKYTDIYIEENDKTRLEDKLYLNGIFKYELALENAKDNIEQKDSQYIINLIKTLVNNPHYKIISQEDKEERLIKFNDFMVITRTKKFKGLIQELFKNNIPYVCEGIALFDCSPSFNVIKRIVLGLINVKNNRFVYEALSTPIFGLDINDFNVLVNNNINIDKLYYEDINEDIVGLNIAQKLYKFKGVYDETSNMSYSEKYLHVLEKMDIFKYVSTDNLDLTYYGLELIRRAEAEHIVFDDSSATSFLQNLNGDNSELERSLRLRFDEDAVHVANVHKVKGLQAPIVIMAARSKGKVKNSGKYYIENDVIHPFSFGELNVEEILDEDRPEKEEQAEGKRIDYVALTRAESVLFIGDAISQKDDSHLSSWSSVLSITPTKEFWTQDTPKEIEVEEKDVDELYKDKLYDFSNSKEKSYKVILPSKEKVNQEVLRDAPTISDFQEIGKNIIGSAIHKMLELIIMSPSKKKEELINHCLSIEKCYPIKPLLEDIYDKLVNEGYAQTNGLPSNIIEYAKSAKERYCEVPFAYKENDNLVTGSMDLVLNFGDHLEIIDYKCTGISDSLILEEKYERQLEEYKNALHKFYDLPIETKIYHIDIE